MLPSLVEGFALTAIEAMACGVPTVVTSHTFGTDVITDGVDGYVVPPRHSPAIAEVLAAWCDVMAGPAHVAERRAAAGEICALAADVGDRRGEALGRRLLVVAHLEAGDLPAAEQQVEQFDRLARRLGRTEYAWYPALWRGAVAFARGQLAPHVAARSELEALVDGSGVHADLLAKVRHDTEVVGVDEGQFFDAELPGAATALAARGVRVIVAGLDQDYLGKPFEPMPQLLAIAEYITKTLAICMVCGNPANHTQRLVASQERVLLGAQGAYEARCRHCFDPTLSNR